jgi:glycosyltransferase involved in cell wall biosynthesis
LLPAISPHDRLRIAHVTATFPPYYGGTGNVCYHNARVLAARGHDVHVFTADWPGEPDDPRGVTVHRLRRLAGVGNAPLLPGLLRLGTPDIVHLHFPFYGGGELVALGRRPYVVTYHQDVLIDGWRGRFTRAHDRIVGRRVLTRAARLCPTTLDYACSSAIADLVARLGDRVVPIPNGVDTVCFRPGPPDPMLRTRHGLPVAMPLLLFVGSMDRAHYFKGIPTLLRALTHRPEVVALLVGEGELRSGYERLAVELGLGSRVRFAGRVAAEHLPAYYRAADFVVLPSETRGEAFGMVLLEAMASGRPVVTTNLPGVRRVVSPGIDGLLVPPGDADALAVGIRNVLSMPPAARAAMGAAGRRTVEDHYSWDRIGEHLEGIYRIVLAERRERRDRRSGSR